MNEYYVYRYTDKALKEVVYIGKTDHSLRSRILAHKKEAAFKKFNCDIDFVRLANSVETDSVEKLLINYYKPAINIKDKTKGLTEGLILPLLNWTPYELYQAKKKSYQEDYEKAFSLAQMDTELIHTAVDCNRDKNMVRFIGFPHVTGLLRYKDKHLIVLEKELKKTDKGYEAAFKPKSCRFIEEHFYEMLFEAWKEVVKILPGNLDEKLLISKTIAALSHTEDISVREDLCKKVIIQLKVKDIFQYMEEEKQ